MFASLVQEEEAEEEDMEVQWDGSELHSKVGEIRFAFLKGPRFIVFFANQFNLIQENSIASL